MSNKTHYKQLISLDYIGAYALDGKDLTVKITSVAQEQVTGPNGKQEMCMVARLDGQKPLILNRTNAKTITKLYNSPFVEDWAGKYITLYPTTTRFGGETVECLRIRTVVPQVKRIDTAGAAATLRACTTLAELQAAYTALPKEAQTATVAVKDEMKAKLTSAPTDPNTPAK